MSVFSSSEFNAQASFSGHIWSGVILSLCRSEFTMYWTQTLDRTTLVKNTQSSYVKLYIPKLELINSIIIKNLTCPLSKKQQYSHCKMSHKPSLKSYLLRLYTIKA